MHDKYKELIAIKLKFEKDIVTQQANIDQEKNAKYMALDKIQELEGQKKKEYKIVFLNNLLIKRFLISHTNSKGRS